MFSFKLTSPVRIPPTEGIKYAGSKLKIIPHILNCISDYKFNRVLDGFTGTTRVAQAFAQTGMSVTTNDAAVWSEVFARCYLKANKPDSFYQNILNKLNCLNGIQGWFSRNYGGTPEEAKKPFQIHNTMKYDAIRPEIEKLNLEYDDKCVILTSLILALDSVDSTLGHFSSYLSKWSERSCKIMRLKLPQKFGIIPENHEVLRGDIFDAIQNRTFDLAYFDPPYGSNNEKMPPSRVRYNSYYHIWKTVVLNDEPDLFGKAFRREDSRDSVSASEFEEYRKNSEGKFIAVAAIDRLIREVQADYILLSYSSGGRATKEELMDALNSNGTIEKVVEIDYRQNVMSAMKWTNEWAKRDSGNQEYLFLLRKI